MSVMTFAYLSVLTSDRFLLIFIETVFVAALQDFSCLVLLHLYTFITDDNVVIHPCCALSSN